MMIRLTTLDEEDYRAWLDQAVGDYAEEKVRSGNWPEEGARQRSAEGFKKYLPEGPATKNAHMYSILDEELGAKVGMIWFSVINEQAKPSAFILDLVVYENYRRRGYGEQAMLAAEEKVRELGMDTIMLHVFGHNRAARGLYEKLGYEVTNLNMMKKLSSKAAE
jgi:ribosomal protein S18 acetylase RimI-like enzyme